ncbi:hypothetical protein ACEOB8_19590 [Escherichia coli]
MLILRRHWLPGEDDSPQSLAAAVWLDIAVLATDYSYRHKTRDVAERCAG